jgi:hypothetical protein
MNHVIITAIITFVLGFCLGAIFATGKEADDD